MSSIITVCFGYFISGLGLFDSFPSIHNHFCMFHNSYLHSILKYCEFSQDDASGRRMSVFFIYSTLECDDPTVLANRRIIRHLRSSSFT